MSAPPQELAGELPVSPTTEDHRRPQTLSWSASLRSLIARLADAAEGSNNGQERRDRDRTVQVSTSGRELGDPGSAGHNHSTEANSLASRSLGGILRQLSGRRDASDAGHRSNSDGDTTAAAAERHRLSGSTAIDLQALTHWSEKNAPFVFILFCVFVSKHIVGLSVFSAMTAVIAACNDFIRKQIALKDGRLAGRIALCMLALLLLLSFPFVWHHSCLSWRTLLLMLPAQVDSVWDCLYCVMQADAGIRLASIFVKMGFLIACRAAPDDNFRRRSQLLTLVEHISLLYRALVPTPLWFVYLYKSRGVVSSIFTGAYLATKCQSIYERANILLSCSMSIWKREAQYGKYLTPEEVLEAGNSCAICQEPMTRPFLLAQCRHVFCEPCLNEWLERQNTCPMCRGVVRPPGMQTSGTGASLLPQLF